MVLLRIWIRSLREAWLFGMHHNLNPCGMFWVFLIGQRITVIPADLKIIVFLNVGIKPVFDAILRPARQTLANLAPLRTHPTVKLDYFHVFLLGPLFATNVRVQLVDESLTDLFSRFGTELLGDQAPVVADLFDHLEDDLVLMRTPDFFALTETANPPEPMKTLILVPVFHFLGDDVPFFGMHLIQSHQPLVFLCGPGFDQTLFCRWGFDSNFEQFRLLGRAI